jgi:hypothetical protein
LGGPKPEEYRTLALEAPANAAPADVAGVVQQTSADIILLTAQRDSAWFADVSKETNLALSGPGRTETKAKAFLTNLKILGDTSIVLGVSDGSRLHVHDALYEIAENRHIDLMLVGVSGQSDLRQVVRTLLGYIATDVGPNAAIMMAIDAPSPQAADSVMKLLRAAYTSATECANGDSQAPTVTAGSLQLFYGPPARVRCESARVLTDPGTPIFAQLVVGR